MTRPRLSRDLVLSPEYQDERDDLLVPDAALLDLPETVLQFGTGAFLRGFADVFLDRANRAGRFGGRAVIVGSTGSRRVGLLNAQDGLYTVVVQGLEEGEAVRRRRIVGSVSRALSSQDAWGEVLALAEAPALRLVVSNTTEVGIRFDEEDAAAEGPHALNPPQSYPGKLAAFLYRRAEAFGFDAGKGLVVLPCELVEENGERLRTIVEKLSGRWGLGEHFVEWVRRSCPFPNTLVDRIVPGTPDEEEHARLESELGYADGLLIRAETYRLWAIEGDAALEERLGFAGADDGIVVTDDIGPYRQRKVRLLNGAHTACVPAAFLAGCETVREAMEDALVGRFIERVTLKEIMPSLDVDPAGAEAFAREVLARFRNPYLEHRLLDIALQQTAKLKARVVPTVLRYAEKRGEAPASIAFGFAAYLLFMRGGGGENAHPVRDDHAEALEALWQEGEGGAPETQPHALAERVARSACGREDFWGTDLAEVPGFAEAVQEHLKRMLTGGVRPALEAHLGA